MIDGTPAITIHAQARLAHLSAGRLHPFVQDGERADRRLVQSKHALGVGEGCAVMASYPEVRNDHHHANSFVAIPILAGLHHQYVRI
jgi:hypothetical protein